MLLREPSSSSCNILSDESNDFQTMRTNRYQSLLKSVLFDEKIPINRCSIKQFKPYTNLLREDWKCRLVDRRKFLPDFETMEKRSVGIIGEFKLLLILNDQFRAQFKFQKDIYGPANR